MEGLVYRDIEMALHALSPVAIANRHSIKRQLAAPDSFRFECELFSFLGSSLARSDTSVTNVPKMTGPQIAPGLWSSLLSELYRPLGIEPISVQRAWELLCRCVINAEKLSGVIGLAEQFPSGGLFPRLRYESRDDLIRIYWDSDGHGPAFSILQMAGYLKLFSWLIGTQIPVPKLQLCTPQGDSISSFVESIFNGNVSGGQQQIALAFEGSWLQRPVIRTYVDLRSILGLPSLALIPWPSPIALKLRVAQLITKTISRHGHAPALGEVASLLGRSYSTLRRQLQQEGTSFQAIKDEWRLQRATELLQSEKPLADIASILGFESNSVFSRAFKSWTGIAPSIFRNTQNSS
jgi:AraC-like DNA-binding protein